ncbi:MAG: hypothetical protein E7643_01510 [Ruminococcaceae bacterium]|nr:hypothetical protein [Oscillospiraceae bacterium]
MCEVCGKIRCPDLCPENMHGSEAPYYCLVCGRPIYVGETAYELEEGVLCEDCMQEAAFEVSA